MKKYLIIGDGESPHILKWTRELDKHFELYLISSRGVMLDIRDILPDGRIFTFELNISESGGNFGFIRMLFPVQRIIKKVKPHYVNAHYITSHGFLAALARKLSRKKFPLIITAWGTDIMVTPFKNSFYRAITRFALRQTNMVTTDSKKSATLVRQFCDSPVITFPFGLEKLPDVAPEDKDPDLFFSNRTLNKNSNIDRVLDFFSKVREDHPRAKLVISNDGPERKELEQHCTRLGLDDAVKFIGFIPAEEQNRLYRKAMFYFSVLASDALSVSLLEAMAYGCIPIVSDLPDNTEWISNGDNGLILGPATEPSSLSELHAKASDILIQNRGLIKERAIFPDAVEHYIHTLTTIE